MSLTKPSLEGNNLIILQCFLVTQLALLLYGEVKPVINLAISILMSVRHPIDKIQSQPKSGESNPSIQREGTYSEHKASVPEHFVVLVAVYPAQKHCEGSMHHKGFEKVLFFPSRARLEAMSLNPQPCGCSGK
jgi:hypothetical protein